MEIMDECRRVVSGETSAREGSFGTFFSDAYLKVLEERQNCPHVASIKIPSVVGGGGYRTVVVGPKQFEQVHGMMAS